MNYYPFHIGDYSSHTLHLEPMEDLAYRRLLDLYYLREHPLPADVQATAKLIRMRSMATDVESVLREFFEWTADGWIHLRCNVEIDAMRSKQQKQREKANKRWQKPEQEHGNAAASKTDATASAAASKMDADAMPPTPTPTPTPTPINKRQISTADKSADIPPGFAEFWETWPTNDRKQAKGKCLDAWKKARAERDAALVIEHVLALKNGSWQRDDGRFVPSPLVYLHQRRWEGAEVVDIRPNGLLAGAI